MVCEFFDGYHCLGEDSPLYEFDVAPTAKRPVFDRQVVTVESTANSEESLVEPSSKGIYLEGDDDELNN